MASQQRIQEYLQTHKIGTLFEELMGKIVVDLPDEPISYLVDILEMKLNRKAERSMLSKSVTVPGQKSKGIAGFDDFFAEGQRKRPNTAGGKDLTHFQFAAKKIGTMWKADEIFSSKMSEEDILAGEIPISVKKLSEDEVQSEAKGSITTERNKGHKQDSQKHKKKLQEIVLEQKENEKSSDSGFYEEKDLVTDNAVELLEDSDVLEMEGATNVKQTGIKTKRVRPAYNQNADVKVGICARCAKFLDFTDLPQGASVSGGAVDLQQKPQKARYSGMEGFLDQSPEPFQSQSQEPFQRPDRYQSPEPFQSSERYQTQSPEPFQGPQRYQTRSPEPFQGPERYQTQSPEPFQGPERYQRSEQSQKPEPYKKSALYQSDDEEFESVSQVSGPRRPVWKEEDNQERTPRKGSHMLSSLETTSKSNKPYSSSKDYTGSSGKPTSKMASTTLTPRSTTGGGGAWQKPTSGGAASARKSSVQMSDDEKSVLSLTKDGQNWAVPPDYDTDDSTAYVTGAPRSSTKNYKPRAY